MTRRATRDHDRKMITRVRDLEGLSEGTRVLFVFFFFVFFLFASKHPTSIIHTRVLYYDEKNITSRQSKGTRDLHFTASLYAYKHAI
jgi:hypothetical protein